jgi:hypothetical protein
MKIRMIKDTPDPRENRNKIIPKGRELECDRSFGEPLVKAGNAKEVIKISFDEIKEKTETKK